MWLLCDAGNTRLKWFTSDGTRLLTCGSVVVDPSDPGHAVEAVVSGVEAIERVVVCNVAGAKIGQSLDACVWETLGLRVESFVTAEQFGHVKNGYVQPRTLGADRWAAIIGARELVEGPICIIDCGTAITVDWVDTEGVHLGGMIVPGRRLMRNSLIAGTGQIRLLDEGEIESPGVLGTSTASCIAAATVGAVAGMIDRAATQLNMNDATFLITGGDAQYFAKHLDVPCRIVPELVFVGLLAFAKANPG